MKTNSLNHLLYLVAVVASIVRPVALTQSPSSLADLEWAHLARFDSSVSASSFGEPVFRLEPPAAINLDSSKGAIIPCLASGSPKPTISWFTSSPSLELVGQSRDSSLEHSSPVTNISNLRQIIQNGAAIRLLPFKEQDFRPDVHSTEYRCVASNQLATIHSRSVSVQAALESEQSAEVKVNDEFVSLNSLAVFRCRTGNGNQENIQLVEWFTSDGLAISAGELMAKGNKFTAFPSGELHIERVDLRDLQRTYGCRLRNIITNRVASSSGLAQLIATDSSITQMAPQNPASTHNSAPTWDTKQVHVLHSTNQLIAVDSQSELQQKKRRHFGFGSGNHFGFSESPDATSGHHLLMLPCAIRTGSGTGQSSQVYWWFEPSNRNRQHAYRATDSNAEPLDRWASSNGIQLHNLANTANQTSTNPPRASQKSGPTGQANSRYIQGSSFLAIEWPTKLQSGRYLAKLGQTDSSRVVCDIDVIIYEHLQMVLQLSPSNRDVIQASAGQSSSLSMSMSTNSDAVNLAHDSADWKHWFNLNWFNGAQRSGRSVWPDKKSDQKSANSDLFDQDDSTSSRLHKIRVEGPGKIEPPPIVLVGERLQIDCLASGSPIDEAKWFRNGQAINIQSSQDFQVEITRSPGFNESSRGGYVIISTLTVRQVQPKDTGVQVFECFGHNNLGDRARAGITVLIVDPSQVDWAQFQCPVSVAHSIGGQSNATVILRNDLQSPIDHQSDHISSSDGDRWEWLTASSRGLKYLAANQFSEAVIMEAEGVELSCPVQSGSRYRVDWRRLGSDSGQQQQSRNLDQLFTGDSRFLANGSSLHIRAPSKRHDEGLYVCRVLTEEGDELNGRRGKKRRILRRRATSLSGYNDAAADNGQYLVSARGSKLAEPIRHPRSALDFGLENFFPSALIREKPQSGTPTSASPIHQSSLALADSAPSCSSLLASTLFGESEAASLASEARFSISSISIRIIAKPKIDPFEFSHNLEDGMRAVAVCAVISGQSPVDISWFKNGQLLVADEQIDIDQANGFTSTLTFHQIRPSHSGLYTCVASNAFASTNHSSKLTVNVAPYFIEAPKSTSAVLNSNVLINCRAGGQPSPQIRWRKRVPSTVAVSSAAGSASSTMAKLVAPTSVGSAPNKLADFGDRDSVDTLASFPQMATQNSMKHSDFRIITSNSHIQILENGSMIIKDVELADATRYICQAFNGINPSLSEVIDLNVLSPAQFEVNYETVTVKRDSIIKFTCSPKGDQPMQIEWFKESNLLVPAGQVSSQQASSSKYSEIVYYGPNGSASEPLGAAINPQLPRQSHHNLILQSQAGSGGFGSNPRDQIGVKSSELLINYADRMDTGNFVCVARNSYGKDEQTYRLLVQENPDAPINLNALSIQSTSLKLTWTLPFDGNSPVNHFIIEYRKQQLDPLATSGHDGQNSVDSNASSRSHREWIRLVVNSNKLANGQEVSVSNHSNLVSSSSNSPNGPSSLSLIVRQLSPRTNYHFRVAAMNAIGQSGFSMPISVTTAEEPPNARLNDLRAQPVSSTSIKALWRAPSQIEESAPIKGYHIRYRKLAFDASSQQAPNLEPQVLQSNWILAASVSTSNTSNFNGVPVSFESRPLSGPIASLASPNPSDPSTYEFTLSGLEKNTKYEIRVQPFNSVGVGPSSDTVGQTLKFDRPSQPHLKLVAARRQSFELRWTIGDKEPLQGFWLFYRCEYDDWQETQLDVIYQYVIDGLRCGTKYQIYLSAFNLVGKSEPSDVLSARTEGTAPIAPEKSRFIQTNISEISLDMTGWTSGGCPITSYAIQYKRLYDSKLFAVSEGSIPFTSLEKIRISDLQPATWYKLMVTAINEAGSTNAEFQFSTLTSSGDQVASSVPSDYRDSGHGALSASHSVFSNLNRLFWSSSHNSNFQDNQAATRGDFLLPTSCLILLIACTFATYVYYHRTVVNNKRRNSCSGDNSIISVPTSRMSANLELAAAKCNGLNGPISLCPSAACNEQQHELYSAAITNGYGSPSVQNNPIDHSIDCAQEPNQALRSLNWSGSANDSAVGSFLSSRSPLTTTGTVSTASGPQRSFVGFNQQFSTLHPVKNSPNPMNCRTLQFKSNRSEQNSSSQSTCCFDGSSSQTSSSGSGAKAKLQLIGEQPDNSSSFVYSNSNCSNANNPSELNPSNTNSINNNQDQQVNLMADQQFDYAHLMNPNLTALIGDQSGDHNFYAQSALGNQARLVSSASFVSGADLMRHQHQFYQQQPESEEPVYQRLDKLQQFCLANGHKQQQLVSQQIMSRAQAIRSNSQDPARVSMTLSRGQIPSMLAAGFQGQQLNETILDTNATENSINQFG